MEGYHVEEKRGSVRGERKNHRELKISKYSIHMLANMITKALTLYNCKASFAPDAIRSKSMRELIGPMIVFIVRGSVPCDTCVLLFFYIGGH